MKKLRILVLKSKIKYSSRKRNPKKDLINLFFNKQFLFLKISLKLK
jgi:hypothetical protein